ncbi:MAG TPA: PKD domain-containing protein, partial [Chryseosolibacter sp.]|nr:PKD domain-containing protein [Chryseosolibacter sp.]
MTRPVAGIAGYGNGGGAVATHPSTGQLLFYTDGATVYDAAHRPMPNGSGLGGNPSGNQPAVIVQVPGQTSRYWIFTNSATSVAAGAVRLSEVDMTLFGNNSVGSNFPAGDVGVVKAQAVGALTNVAEAMILIPHSNGTDYWLVTGDNTTGDFNVTQITAAGVGTTQLQGNGTGLIFRPAHFAYHAASGRLAVAPADADRNVMIFSFDDATGNISFNSTSGFVFNSAVATITSQPAIYDVEWSASGDYLYVSRRGDIGIQADVTQFNLTSSLITPQSVLPNPVFRSFGLQMAPDSAIYHLYQETSGGPFLLSRFNEPDSATAPIPYEVTPIGAVNFNAMQFPSFAAGRVVMTLDFSVSGTCANSPSKFFPIVDPGADSLVWTFGDGNGSNIWSPTHTYTQGQSYSVTMTAFAGDTSQSVTKSITINQFDVQVQLVSDTTACSCELEFPKASPPPPPCTAFSVTATATGSLGAIQWYGPSGALAGQNTLTLTSVDSAGFYYVIVQDAAGSGCAAYAGVNIREYGIEDARSNIWYFGNNGGINFNADFIPSTGADAIVGDLISAEGTAIICDRNGQVIVSTNGEQVYDREGNLLPVGMGGSQNATQSALIMPVPSDPTLYYIFVTQEVYPAVAPGYELRYAIFDLKIAPFGGLIDPDGNPANGASTVLFTRSTERITGNLNWLIAHEYGNNNFRAYRVTALGIEAPVISSIGSDHSMAIPENAQGYMKLSPFNTLAVALSSPGRSNVVEIFDFADSTGAVTNFRTVDLQQAGGQVYGIEFSPGAQKLFASTIGSPSTLHEFAYDSTLGTYVRKATIPVQDPSPEIGAIQMGPDGTIYVAQNGSGALGTITANENPDAPSGFVADGFPLAGGTSSTLGLPNFTQNIVDPSQTPSITVAGVCFGFPTSFMGSGTDPIDTLTWYFGDGSSESGIGLDSVEHTYASPGTYIVTLELSNRCVGLITPALVDTITISPTPNVQSGVVSLCDGGDDERMVSIAPADATPDLIYQWSHGDTTRDPLPPYDADFAVTVTNGAGCSAEGVWEVFDNRPQVELGPNLTLCENTTALTLDAGNPGTGISYEWRRNGVFLDTTRTITVQTTPPSTGDEYLVIIDDAFTSCTIRDSVTITINEDADFTTAAFPPTTCGALDGRIEITIGASGVFTYVVQGGTVPPVTAFDVPGPSGPHSASGLSAGAYTIFVSNQVTGCANQSTETLSDGNFTATLRRADSCATNGQLRVRITTNANQSPYSYRIISSSGDVAASGTNASDGDFLGPVPAGDYTAEVTKLTCTVVTPVRTIAPDPDVPITNVVIDNCAPSIAVTTPTNPAYTWTGQFI